MASSNQHKEPKQPRDNGYSYRRWYKQCPSLSYLYSILKSNRRQNQPNEMPIIGHQEGGSAALHHPFSTAVVTTALCTTVSNYGHDSAFGALNGLRKRRGLLTVVCDASTKTSVLWAHLRTQVRCSSRLQWWRFNVSWRVNVRHTNQPKLCRKYQSVIIDA